MIWRETQKSSCYISLCQIKQTKGILSMKELTILVASEYVGHGKFNE